MAIFKVNIQNEDVLDKILWFLNAFREQGVSVEEDEDEFKVDVAYCLEAKRKIDAGDYSNVVSKPLSEHFKDLGTK